MNEQQWQVMFAEERERGIAALPRVNREAWCACDAPPEESTYYATPEGWHGWFHDPALGGCGAITQTG